MCGNLPLRNLFDADKTRTVPDEIVHALVQPRHSPVVEAHSFVALRLDCEVLDVGRAGHGLVGQSPVHQDVGHCRELQVIDVLVFVHQHFVGWHLGRPQHFFCLHFRYEICYDFVRKLTPHVIVSVVHRTLIVVIALEKIGPPADAGQATPLEVGDQADVLPRTLR